MYWNNSTFSYTGSLQTVLMCKWNTNTIKSLINLSYWQLLESSLSPNCYNNLRDFAMHPNILVVQNTFWLQCIHSNSTWDNTTICDNVIENDMVLPQVGFTDEGIINGIEVTMYMDCGWSPNDSSYILAVSNVDNGEINLHEVAWSRASFGYSRP